MYQVKRKGVWWIDVWWICLIYPNQDKKLNSSLVKVFTINKSQSEINNKLMIGTCISTSSLLSISNYYLVILPNIMIVLGPGGCDDKKHVNEQ